MRRPPAVFALLLVILASTGCRRGQRHGGGDKGGRVETAVLGEVRVGKESTEFYIAYGYDSAVLGFSIPTAAGRARYFPIFGSTNRAIPSVVLEVFASKSEDELWVRSSWADNEILAYHRVGADTTLTQWGETRSIDHPMPDHMSGGAVPFPALIPGNVVKKATFKH